MTLIIILVGIALIILGRKALWLGVCGGTFFLASRFLTYFLFDQNQTTIWIISAVIAGVILVLYLTLEKAMAIILGAIGGGFLSFSIISSTSLIPTNTFVDQVAIYVVGGIIGVLLLRVVFDWAVQVFTALIGAYLVSSFLVGQPIFQLLALVILTIIGVTVQGNGKVKMKSSSYTEPYPENFTN